MATPLYTLSRRLLLILFLSLPPLAAQATSVVQLASEELVAGAELIFQGEVVHTESWQAANGRIYTWVDFSVIEVLKGELAGNGLRLRFTGGQVGGLGLSTGVPIPAVGEQGIYFVESTREYLANPLHGWSQGHFIVNDANEVRAGNGELVTEVEAVADDGISRVSQGVAAGFNTVHRTGSEVVPLRGLSPEEFKARVRSMLENPGPRRELQREASRAGGRPDHTPPRPTAFDPVPVTPGWQRE